MSRVYAEDKKLIEQPKTTEVKTSILAVSQAQLSISEKKISKTVSWTLNFLHPISLAQRKQNLLQEICNEYGVDVIVDPQFIYKRRILGGGKLTVTGYPAKYQNFRALSDDEINAFIVSGHYESGHILFINEE